MMASRQGVVFVALCVAALSLGPPADLPAQATGGGTPDPEIAKGVRLVDDGDYDGAIIALDGAVRRLATASGRSQELSQAYLYLGIAYLAKGHETAARARFREALARAGDLDLEPEKFAPRVIEVFEEAKADMTATAAAAGTTSAPQKKGGGKGLLIGGALLAAGGGAAVAVGGGGGTSASSPTPTPPPTSGANTFTGQLATAGAAAQHFTGPFSPGNCQARLTWSDGRTEVRMFVLDAASAQQVAETNRINDSSSSANWTCTAGTRYRIDLFLQEPPLTVTYTLQLTVP
jgi:hypothetical protein